MSLARVVTFTGVSSDRIEELKREMDEGEQPEDSTRLRCSCFTTRT